VITLTPVPPGRFEPCNPRKTSRPSGCAFSSNPADAPAFSTACLSTCRRRRYAIESEGVPIVMDATSLAYLNGSAIDFDDGLHGKGFEIKNPNAQSTCGCGKSFN